MTLKLTKGGKYLALTAIFGPLGVGTYLYIDPFYTQFDKMNDMDLTELSAEFERLAKSNIDKASLEQLMALSVISDREKISNEFVKGGEQTLTLTVRSRLAYTEDEGERWEDVSDICFTPGAVSTEMFEVQDSQYYGKYDRRDLNDIGIAGALSMCDRDYRENHWHDYR